MKNEKQFNRKCPLCQCEEGKVLHIIKMSIPKEYKLPNSYDVVSCNHCGFTFADTNAKQEAYDHYYEKCNLYSDVGSVKQELYDKTHENDFKIIRKYCEKDDRILDIGCGDGGILKRLKKDGYQNLYGIDPSRGAVQALLSVGLTAETGNIYSEIPKRLRHMFDFVICTAVLEHLLNLEQSIENMKGCLKPAGKIYITVPGIEGFSQYKNLTANYFNHEHINYFNEYALHYLMKKNGLERISNEAEENHYIVQSRPPEFVLSAVYQNTGRKEELARNASAEKEITKYFQESAEREEKITHKIGAILKSSQKIVIWGTGSSTMWLLDRIPALQKKIEYYIDNNQLKVGKQMFGKTIFSPSKLQEEEKVIVVICALINANEIVQQMEQLKIDTEYYILGE